MSSVKKCVLVLKETLQSPFFCLFVMVCLCTDGEVHITLLLQNAGHLFVCYYQSIINIRLIINFRFLELVDRWKLLMRLVFPCLLYHHQRLVSHTNVFPGQRLCDVCTCAGF